MKNIELTVGDVTTKETFDVQEVYMPKGSVVLMHLAEPISKETAEHWERVLSSRLGERGYLVVPFGVTVSVLLPEVHS